MSQVSLRGGTVQDTDDSALHRISRDPVQGWEKLWVAGGEWMNPILIKEVRQSLKSRQFEISFGLTLLVCIGWTFLYLFTRVPIIYYMPSGAQLLSGYLVILLVPLFVVIPFTAFRSLASEIEENTFELLSISALSAKQIIQGKMATSVLQIILYLSALTPCILLTYLMRGVALQSLFILLGMTTFLSLLLVTGGLMLGAVGRTKVGQGGLSVLWLIVLVIVFIATAATMLDSDLSSEFGMAPSYAVVIVSFAVFTIGLALWSVMIQAAASVIQFPSENRSTPIRVRLLLLLAVCVYWMLNALFTPDEGRDAIRVVPVFMIGLFICCSVIGTFMCGERGVIAPRAQRSLPATFAGRLVLTWLGPGAGLGYIFIVTTYLSVALLFMGVELLQPPRYVLPVWVWPVAITLAMYLAFYLGLLRLLMLSLRRHMQSPMVVSTALMAVLQMFMQLGPYTAVSYANEFNSYPYGVHQVFNVPWTIWLVGEGNWILVWPSLIILALASSLVFGLNLMLSARDVLLLRIEAPARVKRETEKPIAQTAVPNPFAD